MNDQNSKN